MNDPIQPVREVFERDEFAIGEPISPNLFFALRDALVVTTDEDGLPISPAAEEVHAERLRQITEEGYSLEGDDLRALQLTWAAHCYSYAAAVQLTWSGAVVAPALTQLDGAFWPWPPEYWKPSPDARRNMVIAAALLAAAGDSLQRERDAS